MTGLIYFNGCQEEVKRAYAPDGTEGEMIPHYASLFIAADQINESGTGWWDNSWTTRDIGDPPVIEFRIPDAADIWFPDEGNAVSCDDLENKLPKLKKKKTKKGDLQNFAINPKTPQTIAEVTIRGGAIEPFRLTERMGLVQWTIPQPSGLSITVVLKDSGESRTITLASADAEVVFSNTHDLFTLDEAGHDALAGNHIVLFSKLNPTQASGILVSQKPKHNVEELTTGNTFLKYMKNIFHTCGETPPCCTH
ncbi:MAG: hypothetical protein ACJ74H_06345 [Thermoanaerobaculia bacterium]